MINYLRFVLIILLLSVVIVSCQKEQDVDLTLKKSITKTDSINTAGNFLAVSGTLQITIGDSIYLFNAAKDSVAFINVNVDSAKYFGITAINKEHTMSFGISSSGSAASDLTKPIAGGQLLFSADAMHGLQYTLTKNPDPQNISEINLLQYMKDSVLTKGTFTTLMTKGGQPNSTSYKVQGSFNLKLK